MAGALFDIKVDTRGFDKTVAKALRDVEQVKRRALVLTANNVKRWMLEAVANNGDVVHRETGEQVVPAFKAMSVIHDLLNGTATGGVLARAESVLLNIDEASGRASVGWGGKLAKLVERWQDGTVGGEARLARPEVRYAIYRQFMRPGYGKRERQFIQSVVHTAPKQPRREFVDLIAAYVAPLMAEWYEGTLVSLITRRHDSYLDRLLKSGESPFTRIAARKASAARYAAKIAYYKTGEYAAIRAARKRELADARNARRRARRAQHR